jgi:hypothetical protein
MVSQCAGDPRCIPVADLAQFGMRFEFQADSWPEN